MGEPGRGRPRQTYIDTLRADTGLQDTRDIANNHGARESAGGTLSMDLGNTTRLKSSKSSKL